MRTRLTSVLVISLLAAIVATDNANAQDSRPNIVIVMTDDQGYPELSSHGNPILRTPNLDQLADDGLRFSDFHVSPMCAPTRGQLLTGLDAPLDEEWVLAVSVPAASWAAAD